MSYLKDYLKVIPKADHDKVKQNITENQELFEIEAFSEQEFDALVQSLVEEQNILTTLTPLSPLIRSDELNAFYKNVAMDLSRLFPEQNHLEQAGENYDRIIDGHLEEIRQAIDQLKGTIAQLEQNQMGEKGLILETYGFDNENKLNKMETLNEDTAYLFTDRNGEARPAASTHQLFHTHYLGLSKQSETNALVNENGQTTAQLNVLYESPYTLTTTNPNYRLANALDGDSTTFWVNVALKPNNDNDGVSIGPKEVR